MLLEQKVDFYVIFGCILICLVRCRVGPHTRMHTRGFHQMLLGRACDWRKIKCVNQSCVFNSSKTVKAFGSALSHMTIGEGVAHSLLQ